MRDGDKRDDASGCRSPPTHRWAPLIDPPLAARRFAAPRSGKEPGRSGAALINIWKQAIIRTPEHLLPAGVALPPAQNKQRARERQVGRLMKRSDYRPGLQQRQGGDDGRDCKWGVRPQRDTALMRSTSIQSQRVKLAASIKAPPNYMTFYSALTF